jgi:hypothetical protein
MPSSLWQCDAQIFRRMQLGESLRWFIKTLRARNIRPLPFLVSLIATTTVGVCMIATGIIRMTRTFRGTYIVVTDCTLTSHSTGRRCLISKLLGTITVTGILNNDIDSRITSRFHHSNSRTFRIVETTACSDCACTNGISGWNTGRFALTLQIQTG